MSPRIYGLLIYYDEDPIQLCACVSSLAGVVDHLVAVDGAYFLYPNSTQQPASPMHQTRGLVEMAAAVGLPLTLHIPREPFYENEVEKRNLSVRLAKTAGATKDDYLLVMDSDFVVRYHGGLKQALVDEGLPLVATYDLYQPDGSHIPFRCIYRCLGALEYGPAHYVVSGLDTTNGVKKVYLWGNPSFHQPLVEPVHVGYALKVNHMHRSQKRDEAKNAYYKLRDETGVEKVAREYVQRLDGEWEEL